MMYDVSIVFEFKIHPQERRYCWFPLYGKGIQAGGIQRDPERGSGSQDPDPKGSKKGIWDPNFLDPPKKGGMRAGRKFARLPQPDAPDFVSVVRIGVRDSIWQDSFGDSRVQ